LVNPISKELPFDCQDVQRQYPASLSWSYRIYPTQTNAIDVYCDMDTADGGWTVIKIYK